MVYTSANIAEMTPLTPGHVTTTPAPLPDDPSVREALLTLGAVVDRYGADPQNPWAIGHALVARGPDLVLTNGEPAIPWLFAHYAEEFDAGGTTLIRFPKAMGDKRVEPHTDLMLKMVTEVGLSPTTVVQVGGKPHKLVDLWRGAVIRSSLEPRTNKSSYAGTNDLPWSLQGIAAWAPKNLQWTALDGTAMSLDDLTTFTSSVLVQESKPLFEAMAAKAEFEKKGQGIFAYTCGGAHLLQGSAYAVARGFGTPVLRKLIEEQVGLMLYRMPRELAIYDSAMKQAPQFNELLLVQRLKFTGHYLETMHKLAALGFYAPTEEQKVQLAGAAQQVVLVTRALKEIGTFDRMEAIRKKDEQMYLDLVGDSAHAINGLLLALGERSVRY